MATIHIDPSAGPKNPPQIEPEETYYGSFRDSHPAVQLRIATGGAGQSGFIKALADAFIDAQAKQTGCAPFAVAWLNSDTAGSFNYLAQGSADLSITYHPAAEVIAIEQGFVERSVYAWRDHFMLVGPSSNPAHLSPNPTATIHTLFAQLFRGAVANPSAVRFLSRYDKSATNIKESLIWTSIGQCPWVDPDSADLYHRYPAFPFQALEAAARLGEYTLVDPGTWWGVEGWVREGMMVFLEGHDSDPDPILLNPAHALVGTWGRYKDTANAFAEWIVREDGGHKVVSEFAVNGVVLYTRAPDGEAGRG